MIEDEVSKEGGTGQGALLGESDELKAADHFPTGVLDVGQSQTTNLRPELRDVLEILGIEIHLFEKSPGGFYGSKVIFGLMLFALALEQPLLSPDAPECLIRNLLAHSPA